MTDYFLIAEVAVKAHFDQYLAHFQRHQKVPIETLTPNAFRRKFNEMSQWVESKESKLLLYDVTQIGEVGDKLIFEVQVKNAPSM